MANYQTHGFQLTKRHMDQLRRAVDGVTLVLKKNNLNGSHNLLIPKATKGRVLKAQQQGKGLHVKLSRTCVKKNQSGGFIDKAFSAIGDVILGSHKKFQNSESEGDRFIRRRLDYLRNHKQDYMKGRGVHEEEDYPMTHMYNDEDEYDPLTSTHGYLATDDPNFALDSDRVIGPATGYERGVELASKMMEQYGDELTGEGPMLDGFLFGLKNPVEAMEFAAREITHQIRKRRARKKKQSGGCLLEGSGIQFL